MCYEDILAETTDRLNVDAPGGRDPNYDALESGDEAARDDVVTDTQSDCSGWVSNASAADGSEPDPERDEMDIALAKEFLDGFGGTDAVLAGNLLDRTLREFSTNGWGPIQEPDVYEELQTPYVPVEGASSYPGLHQGYSGPTPEVLHRGDSPMALFFYFMPVALWQHVAVCSNKYQRDMLHARVDDAYKRHKRRCQANPATKKKTRRDVLQELQAVPPIKPHELCRFVGLLIARTICPNREKLANHWKTTDEGAIPRGAFSSVMARDRFMDICRNLHFNDNDDPRATTDRAWKIRKVVEVLQRTFREGYVPPAELSFDEAMLPSRSRFNKMRVYMKAKPHKWGTKLFMLCSAHTAYCIRCFFLF